jgi:hypothetical protein
MEGNSRGVILRHFPSIYLEGLRKTTKTSVRIAGRSLCRDLNPGPPKYEAGVLTTRQRCSVLICYRHQAEKVGNISRSLHVVVVMHTRK